MGYTWAMALLIAIHLGGWCWKVAYRQIGACRFLVYHMAQQAVRFTVDMNVKEGKTAVFFNAHRELNVLVDMIQLVR
jgi:hypothetical protein